MGRGGAGEQGNGGAGARGGVGGEGIEHNLPKYYSWGVGGGGELTTPSTTVGCSVEVSSAGAPVSQLRARAAGGKRGATSNDMRAGEIASPPPSFSITRILRCSHLGSGIDTPPPISRRSGGRERSTAQSSSTKPCCRAALWRGARSRRQKAVMLCSMRPTCASWRARLKYKWSSTAHQPPERQGRIRGFN